MGGDWKVWQVEVIYTMSIQDIPFSVSKDPGADILLDSRTDFDGEEWRYFDKDK